MNSAAPSWAISTDVRDPAIRQARAASRELLAVIEPVQVDQFDVCASRGEIDQRWSEAAASEEQQFRQAVDPCAGQEAAKMLESLKMRHVHWGAGGFRFADGGDPVGGVGGRLGDHDVEFVALFVLAAGDLGGSDVRCVSA